MTDISYTIGVIGAILLIKHNEYIQTYLLNMWENVKGKTLNDLAIEMLWNGSYAYTFVKYRFGKLYDTFPLVRSFSHRLNKIFQSNITNLHTEYPWASITRLMKSSDDKLRVLEDTFDLSDFEWKDRSISENLFRLKTMARQLLNTDSLIQECLVIIALSEHVTICRVVTRAMDISDTDNSDKLINPSQVKFLMVDYVRPDVEDTLELQVNKSYFMEGNELLSAAFVGRLLPQSVSDTTFDTQYKIVVIDNDFKMVEWNYPGFTEIVSTKKYVLCPPNPSLSFTKSKIIPLGEDDETKSWDKLDKED